MKHLKILLALVASVLLIAGVPSAAQAQNPSATVNVLQAVFLEDFGYTTTGVTVALDDVNVQMIDRAGDYKTLQTTAVEHKFTFKLQNTETVIDNVKFTPVSGGVYTVALYPNGNGRIVAKVFRHNTAPMSLENATATIHNLTEDVRNLTFFAQKGFYSNSFLPVVKGLGRGDAESGPITLDPDNFVAGSVIVRSPSSDNLLGFGSIFYGDRPFDPQTEIIRPMYFVIGRTDANRDNPTFVAAIPVYVARAL